jgi:hypothetical protein
MPGLNIKATPFGFQSSRPGICDDGVVLFSVLEPWPYAAASNTLDVDGREFETPREARREGLEFAPTTQERLKEITGSDNRKGHK